MECIRRVLQSVACFSKSEAEAQLDIVGLTEHLKFLSDVV